MAQHDTLRAVLLAGHWSHWIGAGAVIAGFTLLARSYGAVGGAVLVTLLWAAWLNLSLWNTWNILEPEIQILRNPESSLDYQIRRGRQLDDPFVTLDLDFHRFMGTHYAGSSIVTSDSNVYFLRRYLVHLIGKFTDVVVQPYESTIGHKEAQLLSNASHVDFVNAWSKTRIRLIEPSRRVPTRFFILKDAEGFVLLPEQWFLAVRPEGAKP